MGFLGRLFGGGRDSATTDMGRRLSPPSRRGRSGKYDFAEQRNASGGRKRREATVERLPEEGILDPDKRHRGIALSRDMMRNNPGFRGLAKTIRVNVVGEFGKLRFNATDEWSMAAQSWFNNRWARSADFIDGSSWRECLQLAVSALATEGDFVCVFDDGILTGGAGSGRLAFFEADQICDLDAGGFAPLKEKGYSQSSGVICDRFGREAGVVVTGGRGKASVPLSEAFVLMRDPDSDGDPDWRLVRRKFRLRQSRGSADAIPAIQGVVDSYEMLGLEMQSAKVAASRYAVVLEAPDAGAGLPEGFADEEAGGGAGDAGEEAPEDDYHAEALEHFTGGNTDYMPAGSNVIFDPANRPNPNLAAFLDYETDLAGTAFGLGHSYSRNKADTSYTAFRGDMAMTWMTFRDVQQFMEDSFSDWVARKAIRWAVAKGLLPVGPEGW